MSEENDDVAVYTVGQATPNSNTIIVRWGSNGFLDTKPNNANPAAGDDQISTDPTTGETVIIAGANNVCDTQANNVNITTTRISIPTLTSTVNRIYNQAVVTFSINQQTCLANFDIDKDTRLDISSAKELNIITNKCGKTPSKTFDNKLLFLFQTCWNGSSERTNGFMDNGMDGFFFLKYASDINKTCSHEMGHGYFKLRHPWDSSPDGFFPCYPDRYNTSPWVKKDINNIMEWDGRWLRDKLRKYQWDLIH